MLILKGSILCSIFVVFLIGCQSLRSEELGPEVSQMESKYSKIVQNKIKEFGMDENNMQCQDKTVEWRNFLQEKGKEEGYLDGLYQKLVGADFIVVYCGPKDLDVLGGDVNIFIDRTTNKIIDVLRGQ